MESKRTRAVPVTNFALRSKTAGTPYMAGSSKVTDTTFVFIRVIR